MVVDYNIFDTMKGTNNRPDKLIYVAEENPDGVIAHDISQHFYNFTFFGSYNRAFFQETKNHLNQAKIEEVYGKFLGYDDSNRGKEFYHLQEGAITLKDFYDVLRYNGYGNPKFEGDPSANDAGYGIAARFDIGGGSYSGGIDTKVTDSKMMAELTSIAISGPTVIEKKDQSGNIVRQFFKWPENTSISIKGVPKEYDYANIIMSPKTLCCDNINDVFQFITVATG
jgi:hypothetical protein